MTNIVKLVRMANEFCEEYSTEGMIDVSKDSLGGFPTVHLTEKSFKETFEEYTTETRKHCNEYPFEHYTFTEGVKFFCVTRGGNL